MSASSFVLQELDPITKVVFKCKVQIDALLFSANHCTSDSILLLFILFKDIVSIKKDMDENKIFLYKSMKSKVNVQKRKCDNLDFLFEDDFSKVQLWLYKRDSRRTSKSQGTFDLNFHAKNGV